MAKDLKRRGFRFVGPTTAYALMQATGMVDDHVANCWVPRRSDEPLAVRRKYQDLRERCRDTREAVARTAVLVAAIRAKESARDDRLFDDPFADRLAGAAGRRCWSG